MILNKVPLTVAPFLFKIQTRRSQVQSSTFRVKNKEGIQDPKAQSKPV
jgi:hypothetical protein